MTLLDKSVSSQNQCSSQLLAYYMLQWTHVIHSYNYYCSDAMWVAPAEDHLSLG